jgi:hypothetical protein
MITQEMIDSAIGDGVILPSVQDIIFVVSGVCGVDKEQVVGKRRLAAVVRARHIAIWICLAIRSMSLTAIGQHFGGRDHSTVIHAGRSIDGTLELALCDGSGTLYYERQVLRDIEQSVKILNARGANIGSAADLINRRLGNG